MPRHGPGWLVIAIALCLRAPAAVVRAHADPGAAIFSRKCSSCHTIGRGKLVGPDLMGVTRRRARSWLFRFIRSSRQVILSGEPVAAALFAAFNRQRMPDHDLSVEQLDQLVAYLGTAAADATASGGPALERATPADVQRGFDLFVGNSPLAENRAPCAACHAIRHPWMAWTAAAASFAPDLSRVYAKYGAHALMATVRRACTPRGPDPQASHLPLEQAFVVSAFLRDADVRVLPRPAP